MDTPTPPQPSTSPRRLRVVKSSPLPAIALTVPPHRSPPALGPVAVSSLAIWAPIPLSTGASRRREPPDRAVSAVSVPSLDRVTSRARAPAPSGPSRTGGSERSVWHRRERARLPTPGPPGPGPPTHSETIGAGDRSCRAARRRSCHVPSRRVAGWLGHVEHADRHPEDRPLECRTRVPLMFGHLMPPAVGEDTRSGRVCRIESRASEAHGTWTCVGWQEPPDGWRIVEPINPGGHCSYRVADEVTGVWSCQSGTAQDARQTS